MPLKVYLWTGITLSAYKELKTVVAFLYSLSILPFELLYAVTGYRRCCPATKGMQ